uniref:Chitin deacetylase n=1 Tax=Leucosporidium scottii TaxID=5278 RepID=A0A0H5FRY0_9BASI|nr:hypothetical protein ls5930a1_00137 [Leucosporidium scottii]
MQSYTLEVLNYFFAERKNPNGCPVKTTFFNSLTYNNYSMVTDFYVAGNEVADHTMTHVGSPNASEINGNLAALNAFSGIPLSDLSGFRAPMLNFTAETLTTLHESKFLYDSSATSATPADATGTDAFWPYTLDNGLTNNCLDVDNVCQGKLKLPGLWEIPMYAVYQGDNAADIHLMDPWLDSANVSDVVEWMKSSFLTHYNGNRQPFGIYSHPIHLAVGYPGVTDPIAMREAIKGFLDWLQTHDNVWFVTNQMMLDWIRNPVSIANIASSSALTCQVPDVPTTTKICNGIEVNEIGLLDQCPFADFPWTTCYGCPTVPPTPDDPVPPQDTSIGGFFDPIANTCLCTSDSCAFTDTTRPIGNYSSGTGSDGSSSAAPSPTSIPRQTSAADKRLVIQVGLSVALGVAAVLIAKWA